MEDARITQKGPYVICEKPGRKAWCSCGLSKNQPYCDGEHSGTNFVPEIVQIEKEVKIAWCGCRRTKNPPYCDGSHSSLP